MKIEIITVCVGYGDLLAHTIRENQNLAEHFVVATTESDEETRDVCRRYSLHHILSDDYKRGGPFNKARLIQRLFDQVSSTDWVLHIDSDIVLPRRFRDLVDWAHLDERCIYGCDRRMIVGHDEWMKIKRDKGCWDNHSYQNYLTIPGNLGSRWVSKLHGYVPIGFFQLMHGSQLRDRGIHIKPYQYFHGDAARADVQFALQWDRRFRQLLPEVVVLHLESEQARLGANWAGRTTRRFGPDGAAPLVSGSLS